MATATQYTTVTMDDGRVVDFAGKRRMVKEVITTPEGKIQIRMDFLNGETRIATIHPDLVLKCAGHGASQKFGDEIAGLEDVEDAILAVDSLMDRMDKGEWTVKREGGGNLAGASILARALVEHSGKTVEQVRNFLGTKTQAEKNALRANPALAPIIKRIEDAKAKPKVTLDTTSMLEELAIE